MFASSNRGAAAARAAEMRMQQNMQEQEVRQTLRAVSDATQGCMDRCVYNFRSSSLEKDEKECVEHCVRKFFAFQERVVARFQENQMKVLEKTIREQQEQQKGAAQ
eukprot:g2757.t1